MTPQTNDVVHKELTLNLSIHQAFRAFTEDFDRWWPRSHHIGKAELKQAALEPREGGRWFEIDIDGSECDWGRVVAWQPPNKLVLSWQITAEWKFDPDFSTDVDISFSAESPTQTRLILEHRHISKFGEAAPRVWAAFDSLQGWAGLLDSFARYAATHQP